MIEAPASWAQRAAALLVVLALAALPFFYGLSVNAIVFVASVLLVLAAASAIGSQRIAVGLVASPWSGGVAVFALLVLFVNYQWSLSKDSSFAPLWSLALLPVTFLVVGQLGRLKWFVFGAFALLVVAFSVMSLWMLFQSGVRAALPLTDANNYASLLYLALIPTMYLYLCRYWRGEAGPQVHVPAVLAFVLLSGAVLATQSRTAVVILWVALLVFLAIGISRRQKLWPILGMALIFSVLDPIVQIPLETDKSFAVDELSRGTGVRVALNGTAFEIFLDHPLTGAGVGVFPLLYRQMRPLEDQDTAGLSVHNDYLQLLAEGGPLLFLPFLALALAVGWRFVRAMASRRVPAADFGAVTALGAVLTHALVNFVLLTTALAVAVGAIAAVVQWSPPRPTAPRPKAQILWGVRALFAMGWIAFGFLLVDAHSLGVYQGQPAIPFADRFNRDLDKLIAYSKFLQSINANRGLPVLAEAAGRQLQLDAAPDSRYLQDLTLHSYRRAIATDPWNPHALLQMYGFVIAHPQVSDRLIPEERPEQLLLRSLALDPMFIPALDALRSDTEARGKGEFAYRAAREHVGKWLELLAYSTPDEARRWLAYLREWAVRTSDDAYLAELEATSDRMERIGQNVQLRLWFGTPPASG